VAEPQTKDLLQQEKDKEIEQRKFELRTKELIELRVGQPIKSPTLPKVLRMEEGPGANAIELKVGPNKIRIDEKGITIEGLKIQLKGQIQLQLQAPIVQINADALLQLKGGVIMLN
jgi:hypothetical protein